MKQYNPLYNKINIDHNLLNGWPETLIPAEIVDSMVLVDDVEADAAERSTYSKDISIDSTNIEPEDIDQTRLDFFSTSGLATIDHTEG